MTLEKLQNEMVSALNQATDYLYPDEVAEIVKDFEEKVFAAGRIVGIEESLSAAPRHIVQSNYLTPSQIGGFNMALEEWEKNIATLLNEQNHG